MGNGIIGYLIDSVFSVLFSSSDCCLVCKSYSEADNKVCKQCEDKIQFCQEKFTIQANNTELRCYSAAYYTSTVRELIRMLKYKGDFLSGEFLAELLIRTINKHKLTFDLITYVPMSRKAFKKRGYNQSELLATYVGRHFNCPVKETLLKKIETKDQIGLNGEDRWINLSNCFGTLNPSKVKNKKIILVDDVITTGATAFHSAQQLLLNGAEDVHILTVAKSRL